MTFSKSGQRRLRFYGAGDYATYWQIDDAVAIVEGFTTPPGNVIDVLELYNALQFVEAGFFPPSYTPMQRAHAEAVVPQARSAVARFFTGINETNVGEIVAGVAFEYHPDLLDLLGRYRAFERCDARLMLSAFTSAGVRLGAMLANKKLVQAYDTDLRDALLAEARGAEHLIRRYFGKDQRAQTYLPRSLSPLDSRNLLRRYVDSAAPNLNFLGLIATAPISSETGVDAKLKLEAKRRKDRMSEEFFRDNEGISTGCEMTISDSQDEPVVTSRLDGMVVSYTYSGNWLDETTDYPSILNNFQHLFEFADGSTLLTLPSYPAELGVFERFMTTTGRTDYHVGAAYRVRDMSSTLQTRLLRQHLMSKDIDLESAISWFFEEYLAEQFDALRFSFTPSSSGSTYLQKTRHLFAEMESVIQQFTLFVNDGEIDRDLLAISSDAVRYKQIPSLLEGKYVYPTDHPEIVGVLNALFSDQSSLNYISEELKADTAAELLIRNHVSYRDFADHQKAIIDHLIGLEVLHDTGTRVRIADAQQFMILKSLFAVQAASYVHLPVSSRSLIDAMLKKGWVYRDSSLLTGAEASYFNFHLNKAEFSNGPELRNKYLHGTQAHADTDDAHFGPYITALKLLIALVIKMNDDFCLDAVERGTVAPTSQAV